MMDLKELKCERVKAAPWSIPCTMQPISPLGVNPHLNRVLRPKVLPPHRFLKTTTVDSAGDAEPYT